MPGQTWEPIVEAEKPIATSDLEIVVKEGQGLDFPIARSYEMNMINSHWNAFVKDMARRYEKDILDALSRGDSAGFARIMGQVAGISSMYRLNGARLEGKRLEVSMAVTNFKDYIGTTQHALIDPSWRERLMAAGMSDHDDPNHYFSNPLASCSNIITSDRLIPIGTRSSKVAIYPGVPHVIGGYVKVNGDNAQGFTVQDVDLFSNMRKEFSEEIGLTAEDITGSDFLGIVRNTVTRGPEIVYHISLGITADELRERWRTKSRDKFEHRRIAFYQKEELPEFLRKNRGTMVPSGEAALSLFLKHYA